MESGGRKKIFTKRILKLPAIDKIDLNQDFMLIDKRKGAPRGAKSDASLVWLMLQLGYTINLGVYPNSSGMNELAAIASITAKTLGVMGNQWPIEISNREE